MTFSREHKITMSSRRKAGDLITLAIISNGAFFVEGANSIEPSGYYTLTAEDGVVTLYGDITDLNCSESDLFSLDVSQCSTLERLLCDNNHLSSLDLSQCTELEYLSCQSNQLSSLDMSACCKLQVLCCRHNKLKSLDVHTCQELQGLFCSHNRLRSLELSGCQNLKSIGCSNNRFYHLKITCASVIRAILFFEYAEHVVRWVWNGVTCDLQPILSMTKLKSSAHYGFHIFKLSM